MTPVWGSPDTLQHGEYPIVYYAHEDSPPSVRLLATSFEDWLSAFLTYDAWSDGE